MKKLSFTIFAVICAFVCVITGCTDFSSRSYWFYSMNADADLVISDKFTSKKQQAAERLVKEVSQTLNSLNASLSATVETSYISKFNLADSGQTVEIDEDAYNVLAIAKELYALTEGYYNPAVYYNVLAYGFGGAVAPKSEADLPSDETVAAYNKLASHFGELSLYEESGKYYAVKPSVTVEIDGTAYSMRVDLGGIGKGYATDKINALMEEYGFKYGSFSLGASSMVCKKYYGDGNYNYTLALINPRAAAGDGMYISLPVSDVCLSSSGDDEQYYELEGVRYCHIIDPTTGKPVQTGIMSVTVVGGTAAEGDALTTAIMAMGKEKAVEFINARLSDRRVVFTCDNNGSYEIVTNIPDGGYTVLSGNFKVVSSVSGGKILLGEN